MPQVKPAPVAEPPKVEPPVTRSGSIGCEPYRTLVAKYNWNVQIAMAVMKAESGCNTLSVGDTRPINGLLAPSCGLFQIRTLKGRPSCEALKDPATNVEWAYKVYSGRGSFKPWSVFTNGKYLKYL